MEVSSLFVNQLNRLGRKTYGGFYEYPKGDKKHLWSDLSKHFPLSGDQPSLAEVKMRLLNAQALEALRAFDEGVVEEPLTGDVGSILGLGFPPFTGGIFSYIEGIGLKEFEKQCDDLKRRFGDSYEIPEFFRGMVKNNQTFYGE